MAMMRRREKKITPIDQPPVEDSVSVDEIASDNIHDASKNEDDAVEIEGGAPGGMAIDSDRDEGEIEDLKEVNLDNDKAASITATAQLPSHPQPSVASKTASASITQSSAAPLAVTPASSASTAITAATQLPPQQKSDQTHAAIKKAIASKSAAISQIPPNAAQQLQQALKMYSFEIEDISYLTENSYNETTALWTMYDLALKGYKPATDKIKELTENPLRKNSNEPALSLGPIDNVQLKIYEAYEWYARAHSGFKEHATEMLTSLVLREEKQLPPDRIQAVFQALREIQKRDTLRVLAYIAFNRIIGGARSYNYSPKDNSQPASIQIFRERQGEFLGYMPFKSHFAKLLDVGKEYDRAAEFIDALNNDNKSAIEAAAIFDQKLFDSVKSKIPNADIFRPYCILHYLGMEHARTLPKDIRKKFIGVILQGAEKVYGDLGYTPKQIKDVINAINLAYSENKTADMANTTAAGMPEPSAPSSISASAAHSTGSGPGPSSSRMFTAGPSITPSAPPLEGNPKKDKDTPNP